MLRDKPPIAKGGVGSQPYADAAVVGLARISLILLALLLSGTCVADQDTQNFAAVTAVCTRCHSADAFLSTPRSWQRWNQAFQTMTEHGARGTDEQLAAVTEYFLVHLTIINVNTSPPDEIEWVFAATPAVRDYVVEKRARKKFKSFDELLAVPGIDQDRLRRIKPRILF